MKITDYKNIYFMGIKGVAMTALALCAQDLGIKVTGSDIKEVFVTDKVLKKRGIKWNVGFSPGNVNKDIDLLIATGAHGGLENPEVIAAKKIGIPVILQGDSLQKFAEGKEMVAVCGVGGKTTISAMIATILDHAGIGPSYAVGVGEIFPIGDPGKYDKKGKHFITEADEFAVSPGIDNTPKFMLLDPKVAVATNIEHDHPDIYPTLEDTKEAYLKFFNKISKDGLLVVSADNKNSLGVVKKSKARYTTYGFNDKADWRIKIIEKKGFMVRFNLTNQDERVEIELKVPGDYNVQNAAAAYIVARSLGVEKDTAKKGIEAYLGVKRRFEKVGKTPNRALIVDDYAHHPKEIESVLKVAKEVFPNKRIISIFQPHTYTRTKALFKDFSKSFKDADIAVFTDIYSSAREKKDPSISSEKLSKAVKNTKSFYLGNLVKTTRWLKNNTKFNDLILTLGAGDVFYIHKDLIKK